MKIRVSRCIWLCPHIAKINGELYWITKLRAEHPIRIKNIGTCYYCKKEVKNTNIILPNEEL